MCDQVTAIARIDNRQPAISQADSDGQLIELWLHDRPDSTAQAYAADVAGFLGFLDHKPMLLITLSDVAAYKDQLTGAPRTQNRRLSAVKSLFAFAVKIGYLRFNVAEVVRLHKVKRSLGQKIMPEDSVSRLITNEPDQQRRAVLIMLYTTGCRVSELCGLSWADVLTVGNNGEESAKITLYGKGEKTRVVDLPAEVWRIFRTKQREDPDAAIFADQATGQPLNRHQVHRIVRRAARRVGITGNVSSHWLRHCHATHAIQNGCPLHLIQKQLGHASLATTGIYLDVVAGESSANYLKVPAA